MMVTSLPAAVAEVEGLVKCCVANKQVACLKVLVKHHPGLKGLGVEAVCKLLLVTEGGDLSCVKVLRQLLPDN